MQNDDGECTECRIFEEEGVQNVELKFSIFFRNVGEELLHFGSAKKKKTAERYQHSAEV